MKKYICKASKKLTSFMAFVLCIMVALTLLPADISYASAADDIYDYKLITYEYNENCHGYYFTPKETGKYDTLVMIHGYGGIRSMKNNLITIMNAWVKEGYFPPMVVVIPEIDDYLGCGHADGGIQFLQNFLMYIDNDDKFGTLLQNIESGALSPQIDTDGDILVGGFSMGGMTAVQAGAVHSTRIKKVGALSPANSFITEDKIVTGGYFDPMPDGKKDIYFSKDPDAYVYMSAGWGESNLQFIGNINRYEDAIKSSGNNKEDLLTVYRAPESWGGHSWSICQKEIFMFLYFNAHGVVPSQALVEEACNGITSYKTPTELNADTQHPSPAATVEPYEGKALVELDMSTYVKDTTTDPQGAASIGSIENSGTLASSTIVKMSSLSGGAEGLDLSKQTFTNALGTTTSYLKRTINSQTCKENNSFNTIEDAALEKGANTISFWANYVPENKESYEYNFLDYNVTYDGETGSKHLFTLDQSATTVSEFTLTGRANSPAVIGKLSPPEYANLTDAAAGKWAHYVITNPAYSSNGRKVMKIYVNGEYVYSKMVVKPSGNVTNAKLAFGGDASPIDNIYWPTNFSLGDVKIYDGELTASEIMSEYTLNKDRYTVNNTDLPNITGYTLSDSTVNYDGQSHMMAVSAAANATSDTTVTYTCDGKTFTGATDAGTYPVTATVSKAGYNDLILSAKLKIKSVYVPPVYSDGDVLIDLDMSTYVKDTSLAEPNNVSASIGSVTNNGTLAPSTIVKMSSQSGRWTKLDLSKKSFENEAGSSTSYLYRTINTNVCRDENRFNTIEEKALEAGANTITFWANYVPVKRDNSEYNLFDYSVTYDDEKEPDHLFTLNQQGTMRNEFILTGRDRSPVFGDVYDMASGKWAYYAITNPAYENGSKTMKVYVNGKYMGSRTVVQPTGNIVNAKLAFGGEAELQTDIYWPKEFSLGEVKVFGGVMSDSEIKEAYEDSKDRYIEKAIPLEFNVEFNSASKVFTVSTDSVFSGTNRILLIVKDSSDNVIYMDAKNNVTDNFVNFKVNLGASLKAEEYTFIMSSDGDSILAGSKTCKSNVEGDEPGDNPDDNPDVNEPTFFSAEYDEALRSFIVKGEVSKGDNKSATNRILLMVFDSESDGKSAPCYIDTVNNHKGAFEFNVPLTAMAPVGKYTLVVAADGDVVTSGTVQCEVTDNFETYGNIDPGSSVGCIYTLEENESAPMVLLAVYKNDTLVHVAVSDTVISGKITAEIKFGAGEDTTGYSTKAFVWKDRSTLQPLKRARVLKTIGDVH